MSEVFEALLVFSMFQGWDKRGLEVLRSYLESEEKEINFEDKAWDCYGVGKASWFWGLLHSLIFQGLDELRCCKVVLESFKLEPSALKLEKKKNMVELRNFWKGNWILLYAKSWLNLWTRIFNEFPENWKYMLELCRLCQAAIQIHRFVYCFGFCSFQFVFVPRWITLLISKLKCAC